MVNWSAKNWSMQWLLLLRLFWTRMMTSTAFLIRMQRLKIDLNSFHIQIFTKIINRADKNWVHLKSALKIIVVIRILQFLWPIWWFWYYCITLSGNKKPCLSDVNPFSFASHLQEARPTCFNHGNWSKYHFK